LERADFHSCVVTPPQSCNEVTNASSLFTSPNENQQLKDESVNDINLIQQKQNIIETGGQVASPKNSPIIIGAATIISRKPVAKVEPLDTTNKEESNKNDLINENQQQQQETNQTTISNKNEAETTIICVDFSSDDDNEEKDKGNNLKDENDSLNDSFKSDDKKWDQDCGPLGEVDSTEIYRTNDGKLDRDGKVNKA
jgi:hypothetical protein